MFTHLQRHKRYSNLKWVACLLSCVISFSLQANPTILVLGDSLSSAHRIPLEKGWVTLLSNRLKTTHPNWHVLNHSQSGETTAGGRQRLPTLLKTHQPTVVILELGGNDGLRGIPPFVIRQNLDAMIRLSLSENAKVLLVGMKLPPNYSEKYIEQFEENYTHLSNKYDIPLVPFLLKEVALKQELMQQDRIHPTAKAQPIILENVLPTLLPLLP